MILAIPPDDLQPLEDTLPALPSIGDVRDGRIVLGITTYRECERNFPNLARDWRARGILAMALVTRPKGSKRGLVYFNRDGRMGTTTWLGCVGGRS